MQTASVASPSTAYQPSAAMHYAARVTTYERRDLSVSYSDGRSSVRLSLSQEVLTDTFIYSETGVPVREPLPSPVSDTTESTTEAESLLIEDALARYAEFIADRVEYLLRRIAEASQQITGDETSTSAAQPASLIFAEQTSVVTSTLNIEATGMPLEWSPEATAERIVDFALSFYDGSDRAAYAAKIKAAVMKGFEQALGAMGSVLPQMSYDTIDLAIGAIDQWAQAGINMTA